MKRLSCMFFVIYIALVFISNSADAGIRINPCLNVTKTCTNATAPGGPITFSVTVKNCGDIRIENISVIDDHAGIIASSLTLEAHSSQTFSGNYIPTSSPSINTVTATGSYTYLSQTKTISASGSATCSAPFPCLKVTKVCTDASATGQPIQYSGTVTNCGNLTITNITLEDVAGDKKDYPTPQGFTLNPGSYITYSGSYIPSTSPSTDTVTAKGIYTWNSASYFIEDSASATCTISGVPGNEGCTPGFWKNHPDMWPSPYRGDTRVSDAFGCAIGEFETLWDAISARGGGINKLARHGVAALLNAAHPYVDYPLSIDEVKYAVCTSMNADFLAEYNELSCPLQ